MNERELFVAALQIDDPANRAAYLAEACAADPDRRQRIEGLLAALAQAGSFLQQPPATADFISSASPTTGSPDAAPGQMIGPYKLLQLVGEGGMGAVWMAEQTAPVQRKVAIKFIRAGLDSRQLLARFDAERQALALMDHPNIARVLEAGTTQVGRPYFVMELVKGVPITRYCDEHHLTPRQRLELFVPVCNAVQHAHQKGVIHRDIKPSNVLVCMYDGRPVPKVIDFGVAKATGPRLTDKTLFTEIGSVVGTLEYMSPEQAELNQLDVDTRSDIYSLGVLLYELLTGTTPLERRRFKEAAFLEVLRLIREEEPPRPSTRLSTAEGLPSIAASRGLEPKRLSGMVRGELDWIVMKALEKDRNRRYDTSNGLAHDIERYLNSEAVSACPPSTWYRFRKFAQRNKAALVVTGSIAVVLVLASSAIGWAFWERAEQRESQRVDQERRLTETQQAVALALGRAEPLAEQARKLPATRSSEAAAALVVWRQASDALGHATAALETGTGNDAMRDQVAAVRSQLDEGREQSERALATALRKEKLIRDLEERRAVRLTVTDQRLDRAKAAARYGEAFSAFGLDMARGRTGDLAGQIAAADPEVREALLIALAEWSDDAAAGKSTWSPEKLRAVANAAETDEWRKRLHAATAGNDRDALRALSAEALRQPLTPSALVLLATDLDERGLHDDALKLLRHGRTRHPADFWLHFVLGALLRGGRDRTPLEHEQQLGCFRTAVALRPGSGAAHNNLGGALYEAGQLEEALAELRSALACEPNIAMTHTNIGYVLKDQFKLMDAEVEFARAVELDPKDPRPHDGLGQVFRAQKRVGEAQAEFESAIKLAPGFAWPHYGLGQILHDRKLPDAAVEKYQKAIALDPKFAWPHFGLGQVHHDRKQLEPAADEYRAAIRLDPKLAAPHFGLGNILFELNRLEDAVDEYRKAIELEPRDPSPHNNLGNTLRRLGRFDGAIAEFRNAIALDDKNSAPHTGLGNVFLVRKQLDLALAEYEKAIELNPQSAVAHLGRGNVLIEQRKFDKARGAYQAAIQLRPDNAKAYNGLGNVLLAEDRPDEALAEFKKAVDRDALDARPHFGLGRALHSKNRTDEAISEFKKAIQLDLKDLALRNDPAWLLANCPDPKGRDPKAAIEFARQAVDLSPNVATPWNTLGTAQYRAGDWKAAIDALNRSVELGKGGDSFDWFFLAMAHWRLGEKEPARKHYDQAVRWMDANPSKNEELARFREEAERLLELKK